MNIAKFEPAVDRRVLIILSGITWSCVGVLLCSMAVIWLLPAISREGIPLGLAGIALSLLIHHFGFLKLVDRNIERIQSKNGKICVFAFQAWKSYMIIAVMIGMGALLRSSSLPKPYLAIIYIGFGGAMILSSIRYHRTYFKFPG